MAHLSGTIAHASAGKLQVCLSGTYVDGVSRDAGFPSGTSNLLVRAFVGPNDGTTRKYTVAIDRNAPVAMMEMDYPGGGVSWPVGTEEVAHLSPSGLYNYSFKNLTLTVVLRKR